MTATTLQAALLTSVGFETKTVAASDRQIRLLGRVPPEGMTAWLSTLESLLRVASENTTWTFDASKQYFLRGDKLLYGWRLIFQGENLTTALDSIIALIQSVKPAQKVMDVPLYAPPTRNALRNGKGARPVSGSGESGPVR